MPSLETVELTHRVPLLGDNLVVFGTLASPLLAANRVARSSTPI